MKDGIYKTMPKYGVGVRIVTVKDGIVTGEGWKYSFFDYDFFKVNIVLEEVTDD